MIVFNVPYYKSWVYIRHVYFVYNDNVRERLNGPELSYGSLTIIDNRRQ